jgi:hypothetical protein
MLSSDIEASEAALLVSRHVDLHSLYYLDTILIHIIRNTRS